MWYIMRAPPKSGIERKNGHIFENIYLILGQIAILFLSWLTTVFLNHHDKKPPNRYRPICKLGHHSSEKIAANTKNGG
jgi:hypothetical protein